MRSSRSVEQMYRTIFDREIGRTYVRQNRLAQPLRKEIKNGGPPRHVLHAGALGVHGRGTNCTARCLLCSLTLPSCASSQRRQHPGLARPSGSAHKAGGRRCVLLTSWPRLRWRRLRSARPGVRFEVSNDERANDRTSKRRAPTSPGHRRTTYTGTTSGRPRLTAASRQPFLRHCRSFPNLAPVLLLGREVSCGTDQAERGPRRRPARRGVA